MRLCLSLFLLSLVYIGPCFGSTSAFEMSCHTFNNKIFHNIKATVVKTVFITLRNLGLAPSLIPSLQLLEKHTTSQADSIRTQSMVLIGQKRVGSGFVVAEYEHDHLIMTNSHVVYANREKYGIVKITTKHQELVKEVEWIASGFCWGGGSLSPNQASAYGSCLTKTVIADVKTAIHRGSNHARWFQREADVGYPNPPEVLTQKLWMVDHFLDDVPNSDIARTP